MKKLVSPWTFYKKEDRTFNKIWKGDNLMYRQMLTDHKAKWSIYYNDKMQIFTSDVVFLYDKPYIIEEDIPTFYSLEHLKAEIDYQALKRGYVLLDNLDLINLL